MIASSAKATRADTDSKPADGSGRQDELPGKTAIVSAKPRRVKALADPATGQTKRGRPKRTRRQSHGSAWHWKQTDSWYYTLAGTKIRMPLLDEEGNRIRGIENKQAAQLAVARVKLGGQWQPTSERPPPLDEWLVAKVCSEYIQYCERGAANATVSLGYKNDAKAILNDLCKFCGALPVAELKKVHVKTWVENHSSWKSPATRRNAIAIVLAAFNLAQEDHDVPNPLKGLKKPASQPRLHSLSKEDEQAVYAATDEAYKNFLFAALHTGLRPFCELAKITANEVEETPRGMMWRVYSSKTKKTRKIPVRAEVAELTRELIKSAPAGSGKPLFRNPKGNPWKRVTGVSRFLKIKRTLKWDKDPVRCRYSTYSCRHTFAHRMLSGYWNNGQGCSIETLAELIGDTPKVAFDHYGREWGQHYQDPLWAAIGIPQVPVGGSLAANRARGPKKRRPR